jgi:hypothetical protein
MKKRSFISVFILIITLLIVTMPASAENWSFIKDMGVGKVMLDVDSIKGEGNSIAGARIKIVSYMRSYADSKAVKEVVTYYEFDCNLGVYSTIDPIYYFSDGSREKTKETSPWQDSGDNLTQTLKDYLCR